MAQKPVGDQKACAACGRYHGSVTVLVLCLERELAAKRAKLLVMEENLRETLEILTHISNLVK
jgi:hypothetical protein